MIKNQMEDSKQKLSSDQKLKYQGSEKEKKNDGTTLPKTLRQNILNTKSPITRNTSPVSQLIEIKNIKNDEFLFRMKLKFIACMQQLQISKDDIQSLRKQQSDSDILNNFLQPVKRQFVELKKYKDEYLMKQSKGQFTKNNIKTLQSLEMISLSTQLHQFTQTEKKLKQRCQKLSTQNTQLYQKLKQKQNQNQQNQNNLYKTKLLLKQYESVIENLKQSSKKLQRDFGQEKQRLNEQINGLKQLLLRQRQAKQIYLSKLQNTQISLQDKQEIIKRLNDDLNVLNKECIKWKNRAQWKENETTQEAKQSQIKIYQFEAQIQKLSSTLKSKQTEIALLNKQAENNSQSYNKKLQKIVQEWKTKLIQNVQQYEVTIQKNQQKIQTLTKDNLKLKQTNEQLNTQIAQISSQYQQIQRQSVLTKKSLSNYQEKLNHSQNLLQQKQLLYTNKIRDFETIITQLQSQLSSKSLLISQLTKSQQQIQKSLKQKKQTQNKLLHKISTLETNKINEINKSKKQIEEKTKQIQKLTACVIEVQTQKIELVRKLEKTQKQLRTQQIQMRKQRESCQKNHSQILRFRQNSRLKQSVPSVNNSLNMGSEPIISSASNNKFSIQSYEKNQRSNSIRRVFVRSNSINQYLKEHLKQNHQNSLASNQKKSENQGKESQKEDTQTKIVKIQNTSKET